VEERLGDHEEAGRRRAVGGQPLARFTDLQQELAVLRELQDVAVVRSAVAADPDVALVVDVDAVVRGRPGVARAALTAPPPQQRAGRIELENRRRDLAALAGLLVGGAFDLVEDVGPVHDPHVVLGIDPQPDRLALVHPVGQRFRERRIDLEPRRHHGAFRLRLGRLLQHALAEAEHGEQGDERRANQKVTHPFHTLSPVQMHITADTGARPAAVSQRPRACRFMLV
jgi:hypothetical protein